LSIPFSYSCRYSILQDVGIVQGMVVLARSLRMWYHYSFGDFEGWFLSVNRSSPAGAASLWKCADRGVEEPSSQNSTSPSALREPRLTRPPFSFIRSSIVTDLSEKIYTMLAAEGRRWHVQQTNLQVVADQMPVLATRARDQYCPLVIALLRQSMRRACLAHLARECKLIGWHLISVQSCFRRLG
jgi:hypothetical protein